MARLDFTPDRIIREIAKIAEVNAADFVTIDDDGKPHLDLTDVKRAQMAAIASVDSETTEFGVKSRIKTHDKLKALGNALRWGDMLDPNSKRPSANHFAFELAD